MSIERQYLLICDTPGKLESPKCWGVFGEGDTAMMSPAVQRKNAKAAGWHHSHGKDFCPECFAMRKKRVTGKDPHAE